MHPQLDRPEFLPTPDLTYEEGREQGWDSARGWDGEPHAPVQEQMLAKTYGFLPFGYMSNTWASAYHNGPWVLWRHEERHVVSYRVCMKNAKGEWAEFRGFSYLLAALTHVQRAMEVTDL